MMTLMTELDKIEFQQRLTEISHLIDCLSQPGQLIDASKEQLEQWGHGLQLIETWYLRHKEYVDNCKDKDLLGTVHDTLVGLEFFKEAIAKQYNELRVYTHQGSTPDDYQNIKAPAQPVLPEHLRTHLTPPIEAPISDEEWLAMQDKHRHTIPASGEEPTFADYEVSTPTTTLKEKTRYVASRWIRGWPFTVIDTEVNGHDHI